MSKYLVTTIKTAALLLAVLLMLTACGGSPKEEPPQVYVIGEDSLPSLNALVTLADDISFTQSTGEDGETITYTYSGLEDSAKTAQEYATALESDYECSIGADETTGGTADFTAVPGQAVAICSATDPAQMLVLTIQWEETSCSVTPSLAQAADLSWSQPEAITLEEATAYVESLPASYLQLSGSMDEYNVIPQEGTVHLDDKPCLCINIYLAATHQFQNSYLLTLPDMEVYLLNRETGEATPLG